jgi:hypothetical protein
VIVVALLLIAAGLIPLLYRLLRVTWNKKSLQDKIVGAVIVFVVWNLFGMSGAVMTIRALSARPERNEALIRLDPQGSISRVVLPDDRSVWKDSFIRMPRVTPWQQITSNFMPGLKGESRHIVCNVRLEVRDYDEYLRAINPSHPRGESSSEIDPRDQRTFNETTFQALMAILEEVQLTCNASPKFPLDAEELKSLTNRVTLHPEVLRRGLGVTIQSHAMKP